jgi:hypothetical protein
VGNRDGRAAVSVAMHHRPVRLLVIPLLAIAIAGCSLWGASSAGIGGGRPANPGDGSIPGGGGGSEPTPGGTFGDALPPGVLPVDPPRPVNPLPADPVIVTAHPGQANLHPVSPYELSSRIDGTGHVIVRVRWWGGIEPCDVLDSVNVSRDGTVFSLSLQSGAPAGLDVACIEIARDTATIVDLGVLPAGTYLVRANSGEAPPLTIAVP